MFLFVLNGSSLQDFTGFARVLTLGKLYGLVVLLFIAEFYRVVILGDYLD